MKPQHCTSPYTDWDINLETATFCSPSKDSVPPGQALVFTDEVTNGSISASITAIEGQWNPGLHCEFHECALMFRYSTEDQFYVAGIGGFGQQFYIAKSLHYTTPWQLLQATGSTYDLQKGKTYHLRIEVVGERMTLFSDGVAMISTTDETYASGVCGLRTNRTQARFENVDITPLLRVFLCHSTGDKPAIRHLYRQLCADGFDPWLDEENLLPGAQWRVVIRRAVRESDVVIVCLSRGSIGKTGFIQREIKYALDIALEKPEGTIFLIPLKLEECEVPESLGEWQWVNFFEDNGYERLKRALRVRAQARGMSASF